MAQYSRVDYKFAPAHRTDPAASALLLPGTVAVLPQMLVLFCFVFLATLGVPVRGGMHASQAHTGLGPKLRMGQKLAGSSCRG